LERGKQNIPTYRTDAEVAKYVISITSTDKKIIVKEINPFCKVTTSQKVVKVQDEYKVE